MEYSGNVVVVTEHVQAKFFAATEPDLSSKSDEIQIFCNGRAICSPRAKNGNESIQRFETGDSMVSLRTRPTDGVVCASKLKVVSEYGQKGKKSSERKRRADDCSSKSVYIEQKF